VADVTSDILLLAWAMTWNYDGVVTTDGAWGGGERVGCTEHGFVLGCVSGGGTAASFDDVLALPDHGNDGTGSHV